MYTAMNVFVVITITYTCKAKTEVEKLGIDINKMFLIPSLFTWKKKLFPLS